jgi:hypothetical protein
MYRERIRATPLWKKDAPRYDCVLVENDPGFAELRVARAHLLFSVEHEGVDYPCALVEWFPTVGHRLLAAPKGVVRGALLQRFVIHLDALIFSVVHMRVRRFVSRNTVTLNVSSHFYFNHHIDPHAFEALHWLVTQLRSL